MKNYTIRNLKLYDVVNLFNLFRAISEEDKKFFNSHSFDYADAVRVCTLSETSLDKYYVITDEIDIIVGYGMLRGWNEGYKIPMLGIYISPSVRGEGLAKKLILYMLNKATSTRVRLKVSVDNIIALSLYKKVGFKELVTLGNFTLMEYIKE